MDLQLIERIIIEEVKKVLAERQRGENTILPPNQNETLDSFACKGPSCSATATVESSLPESPAVPLTDGPAVLVMFTGAKEKWDVLTDAFTSWRNSGVRLDALFSHGAKEVISIEEVTSLGFRMIDKPAEIREIIFDFSRYAAIFLPSISRTHAAKLALGITDNLILNMSISALAQSMPVFATDDGLAPTGCVVCGNNVPGIQDVLDKYREHLAVMGLKLMPTEDCVKSVQQVVLNKAESGPDLIVSLVTEEDAANLKGPVVKAARGGLITPLAMELLNKRGIEVVVVPQK